MRIFARGTAGVVLVLASIALVSFAPSRARAAGSGTISFQGTAVLADGTVPLDGPYAMQFILFNAQNGGIAVWIEDYRGLDSVPIVDGVFSVELGSLYPFAPFLFLDNDNLWLEVGIDLDQDGMGIDTTFAPRTRITTAPFAFDSERARQIVQNFSVADGERIAAGDFVALLENGSVRRGSGSPFGPEIRPHTGLVQGIVAAALSPTRIIVLFVPVPEYSLVGMIVEKVGSSFSVGEEIVLRSASQFGGSDLSIATLSEETFVLAYRENSRPKVVLGRVDAGGSSIIIGEQLDVSSQRAESNSLGVWRMSPTRVIVAYMKSIEYRPTLVLGERSGTTSTLTFGSPMTISDWNITSRSSVLRVDTLDERRIIASVSEIDSGSRLANHAVIGELNGTSFTFGAKVPFVAGTRFVRSDLAALSGNSAVFVFRDPANANAATARLATVDGIDLTFGPKSVFEPGVTRSTVTALSETAFLIHYDDPGNLDYGTAITGRMSGASLLYSEKSVFEMARAIEVSVVVLSEDDYAFVYQDQGDSGFPKLRPGQTFSRGPAVAVGVAAASTSANGSVPVIVHGVSSLHSGLATGKLIYALPGGGLTSQMTPVRAGLALSSTDLLLDIQR